jgi:hypothetical protein
MGYPCSANEIVGGPAKEIIECHDALGRGPGTLFLGPAAAAGN